MESSIWKQAAKFLRDKKINRRWLMVFVCLAVIAAAGTVTALKYNGQAMTYKQKVLDCGYQIHKHTASCYDKENKLVCGLADYVVHTHNDDCYSANGKLVCTLPEVKEHQHDSSCYKNESILICTQAEAASHVHGDSCYTAEQGDLTCGTEAHQHGDSCYDENGELTCTLAEHQHSDACYGVNQVLTCTQEEGAGGHTHTDSCYKTEKVLACGKLENHTHSKTGCYDANGKLTCDKTVLEKHVHSDDCFTVVEMTPEEFAAMSAPSQTDDAEDSAEESGIFFMDVDGENAAEAEDSSVEDESKLDEEPEYRWMSDSGDDYTVTVAFEEDALPEDVELNVREIVKDTADYEKYYAQMLQAVLRDSEAETEEDLGLERPRFFDITFLADDEEVEPTRPVVVNISYKDGNHWTEETYGIAVHFTETGDTETIPTDIGTDGYTFVGNSFSVYGVAEAAAKALDASGYASNGGSTLADDDTATVTVNLYAFINGKAQSLNKSVVLPLTTVSYSYYNYYYYYYVPYTALVNAYTEAGLAVSGSLGSYPFATESKNQYSPCTISTGEVQVADGYSLPTFVDIYYLPKNGTKSISSVDSNNYFYAITTEGVGKIVSGPTYVLSGESAEVTVRGAESWSSSDGTKGTDNGDGTFTFNFESVKNGITLTGKLADGQIGITYYINIPSVTGTDFTVSARPTILEEAEKLSEVVPDPENYVVKKPNPDRFYVNWGGANNRTAYIFQGWSMDKTTVLTDAEILGLLKEKTAGVIELYGVWTKEDQNTTVNFYVNKAIQLEGSITTKPNSDEGTKVTDEWTQAVAVAGVKTNQKQINAGTVIIGANEVTSASEARNYTTTIKKFQDGERHKKEGTLWNEGDEGAYYQLDYFPDDETVFAALKNLSPDSEYTNIKKYKSDEKLLKSELNSQNYTIYWIVFKTGAAYNASAGANTNGDPWHIDGVLVAKNGRLAISKTFIGDQDAIREIKADKNQYSITVTEEGSGEESTLYLSAADYDEATDTYTWELDLPKFTNYIVREKNYVYESKAGEDVATVAKYRILNSADSVEQKDYNVTDGIPVQVESYSGDVPVTAIKTVALENSYIPKNSILLDKKDDSGKPLQGIQFKLLDQDRREVQLYQDSSGNYYAYVEQSEASGLIPAPGNCMTTSAQGITLFNIKDVNGTYYLVETATTGYQSLAEIELHVKDGAVTMKNTEDVKLESAENDAYSLRVTNTAKTQTFTVKKEWADDGIKKQPVTIQLRQNDVALTDPKYTVILDGETDEIEETSWEYTWTNLPAYVGGDPATYTVREICIGDTAYSSDVNYGDGYAKYTVTYKQTGEQEITVTNALDLGALQFTKVDAQDSSKPLQGVTFTVTEAALDEDGNLVKDESGNFAVEDGTTIELPKTDANGKVIKQLPVGTYILKEKETLESYVLSDTEYVVTVQKTPGGTTAVTITDPSGKTVQEIENVPYSTPLPESGGPGTTIYTFGAIAIFAMCLVYGCSLRRRRERRTD